MAAQMHDHIHLDTADPPVATYAAEFGSLDATPGVAMITERALTGKLHIHRLLTGGGDVVQFVADTMRLRATNAERITLQGLAGKTVYYTAHYHDDDEDGAGSLKAWAASVHVKRMLVVFRPGSITNRDPKADYWFITIELVDDHQVT